MDRQQAAVRELIRAGKVSDGCVLMVIPSQCDVLVAVGGRNGELYANVRALTNGWAADLRTQLPELASDIDRLHAMRAKWLDGPPADRSFELTGCADPNCQGLQ